MRSHSDKTLQAIVVRSVTADEVWPLKLEYRERAACQLVSDSLLRRGAVDPYLIQIDGEVAGYGAVENRYDPGRTADFYLRSDFRDQEGDAFAEFLRVAKPTEIEAQTNIPWQARLLDRFAEDIRTENYLFGNGNPAQSPSSGVLVRRRGRNAKEFGHDGELPGAWVLEANREVVAFGDWLTHYNPPYADIFMEVAEAHRGKGYGSILVSELIRLCRIAGLEPAARCRTENEASRRTLLKGGFAQVGEIRVGDVA